MSEIFRSQQKIQDLDSALQIQYAKNLNSSGAAVTIATDERPRLTSSPRIERVNLVQELQPAATEDDDEVSSAAETIVIDDENNSKSKSQNCVDDLVPGIGSSQLDLILPPFACRPQFLQDYFSSSSFHLSD